MLFINIHIYTSLMKKKEDLLGLIQSLSTSEKRYFKLFIGKNSIGGSSHYLKLFDLIDKAGSVDKKIIQKLYKDDDFMTKQFFEYKYRLYRQILKSLSAYHSNRSVDDKILESIRQIKILYDRAMYADALKVLEKIKSTAFKYEKFALLLEIMHWRMKISSAFSNLGKTNKIEIRQLVEEEASIIHVIGNASKYRKIKMLMNLEYMVNREARGQADIDMYKTIINDLENEDLPSSYHAKKDFYETYILYFVAINDLKAACENNKNIVSLIESQPFQIEQDPLNYVYALYNLLFLSKNLKKYKEFFHILSKIKSTIKRFETEMNENTYSMVLAKIYDIEFATYIDMGQFPKATALLPEIERGFTAQEKTSELQNLLFKVNTAILYFGTGDFRMAIAIIHAVLNDGKTYLPQSFYSFIRIFQLIIHFEKGNRELLPYMIKSVYRHLIGRKHLYKAEDIFIQLIRRKQNKMNTKEDRAKVFKALKSELMKVSDDPMEASFYNFLILFPGLKVKLKTGHLKMF